jgi:hypothetical protein
MPAVASVLALPRLSSLLSLLLSARDQLEAMLVGGGWCVVVLV